MNLNKYTAAGFLKVWGKYILMVLFLILLLFSGNKGFKMYSNYLKAAADDQEILIEKSKLTQDSLVNIITEGEKLIENLRNKNKILNRKNKMLYVTLQEREKLLYKPDTSFNNNAKRITNSTNRFYKKNDSTR